MLVLGAPTELPENHIFQNFFNKIGGKYTTWNGPGQTLKYTLQV